MSPETYFARYKSIIDDWPAFQTALAGRLPTTVWTNTLRTTPAKLQAIFQADDIQLTPIACCPDAFLLPPEQRPGQHWAYSAGLYHVQELVSMLPVFVLDPKPGERILDLCAAPGNKSAQIAVKLGNTGTVIANDISYRRMRASRQTLERLGLLNVTTTTCDGANFPKAAGLFDKVLVDVPCSAEGTYRKDRKVIYKTGLHKRYREQGIQQALLRKAVARCRPGGLIVYATCTFAPEENERVVSQILQEFGPDELQLKTIAIPKLLTKAGLTEWAGETYHPSLGNARRIWPHHNDTGGFFIAALEKASNTETSDISLPLDTVNPNDYVSRFGPISDSLLPELSARFDIPQSQFDAYNLFQRNVDRAYIVNREHQPPPAPDLDAVGITLFKTGIRFPKLTTAGAMLFGRSASRNIIDLTALQVEAYLGRQQIPVSIEQTEACTDLGYVLIRYQDYVLGVAFYRPLPEGGGLLTSLFPKGWSSRSP